MWLVEEGVGEVGGVIWKRICILVREKGYWERYDEKGNNERKGVYGIKDVDFVLEYCLIGGLGGKGYKGKDFSYELIRGNLKLVCFLGNGGYKGVWRNVLLVE